MGVNRREPTIASDVAPPLSQHGLPVGSRTKRHITKRTRAWSVDATPVGDVGGHDGTGRDSDDSGLSVADEPPDLPLSSHRGPACQSSSVSHRVSCAAGNLDTPRNSGAANRDLANARPVSPSASYLKGHQVTKCPCSWFGASFVSVPSLRRRSVGPPPSAIHGGGRLSRHPCRSAHSTSPAFSLHPSRDLWRPNWRAHRSKIKINSEHSCPS
jgi:hypothetical protein